MPCLDEHAAECPGCQAAAACRRPNAVADVAEMAVGGVQLMPQGDASEDLVILNDPSVRAVHSPGGWWYGRIRLPGPTPREPHAKRPPAGRSGRPAQARSDDTCRC